MSANVGYKLNRHNTLKLYSQTSNADRNTSLVTESESRTRYVNAFNRNLLEYEGDFGQFTTNLKTVYLVENYQYYADNATIDYTYGKTESLITKGELEYSLSKSTQI